MHRTHTPSRETPANKTPGLIGATTAILVSIFMVSGAYASSHETRESHATEITGYTVDSAINALNEELSHASGYQTRIRDVLADYARHQRNLAPKHQYGSHGDWSPKR